MEKVKFEELFNDLVEKKTMQVMNQVKNQDNEQDDAMMEQYRESLGMNKNEFRSFRKRIAAELATDIQTQVKDILLAGNAVEMKGTLMIAPQESDVRKNEDGSPRKRLSIRTRERFKETLNQ